MKRVSELVKSRRKQLTKAELCKRWREYSIGTGNLTGSDVKRVRIRGMEREIDIQ